MNVLMYSDFCKLIPSTKFLIEDNLSRDASECKVLFIPLATNNKSYVSRCYDWLIKLGFKTENIKSISPVMEEENFDVVFVCGGNNAVLKEKLINWEWWNKLYNLIINDALYIGDSSGAVILGKAFEFSLEYEPYCGKLSDFSGYGIINKYLIVHYSLQKMSSDGKINDATDYFNLHFDQLEKLGKENCLTIGNNEVFKITDDGSKLYTYTWEEIQENYMRDLKC